MWFCCSARGRATSCNTKGSTWKCFQWPYPALLKIVWKLAIAPGSESELIRRIRVRGIGLGKMPLTRYRTFKPHRADPKGVEWKVRHSKHNTSQYKNTVKDKELCYLSYVPLAGEWSLFRQQSVKPLNSIALSLSLSLVKKFKCLYWFGPGRRAGLPPASSLFSLFAWQWGACSRTSGSCSEPVSRLTDAQGRLTQTQRSVASASCRWQGVHVFKKQTLY